jgi:hypothetical protein
VSNNTSDDQPTSDTGSRPIAERYNPDKHNAVPLVEPTAETPVDRSQYVIRTADATSDDHAQTAAYPVSDLPTRATDARASADAHTASDAHADSDANAASESPTAAFPRVVTAPTAVVPASAAAAAAPATAPAPPTEVYNTRPSESSRPADSRTAEQAFERPQQRVVYVDAPVPPRKKSNRGIGIVIALTSAIVFAILFAATIMGLFYASTGRTITDFVTQTSFFVPVILFAVGFVLLVVIANRANWWAYVLGSLFVGLFVYFGTILTLLLLGDILAATPDQAALAFSRALENPLVIAAGLLAREISLWTGAAISARGRRVKAKNLDAQEQFNLEQANRRSEYASPTTSGPSY